MTTKAAYHGGNLTYYDSSSQERVGNLAAVNFYDDFLGKALNQIISSTGAGAWDEVNVNNGAVALVSNGANGQVSVALTNAVGAQDAVLYFGDQLGFNLLAGAIMEFRAKVSVLPTLTAQAVLGFASAHNLAKDSVVANAWFKFDGSGAALCETDDATTDNDDGAAGVTVAADEWHIFRIDATNIADVRFYIDGDRVCTGTTFDMSAISESNAIVQPYFSLDKDADAGVGTVLIDFVRVWSNRE